MKTQRILILLTLLNISALFLFAFKSRQETFDKIRVREFELVDEKGQNRVSIKVEPDGELVFRMKDETGTENGCGERWLRATASERRNGAGAPCACKEREDQSYPYRC